MEILTGFLFSLFAIMNLVPEPGESPSDSFKDGATVGAIVFFTLMAVYWFWRGI